MCLDKKLLRQEALKNLSPGDQEEDRFLCKKVCAALAQEPNVLTIASFLHTGNEFPTRDLLETLHQLRPDFTFYAPRVLSSIQEGAKMDFFPLNFGDDGQINYSELDKNAWDIWEPRISTQSLLNSLPKQNLVFIVPGLLFDEAGYRIGYGGGYYDRYLKHYKGKDRVKLIGIVREKQFYHKLLPRDNYDIPVDMLFRINK